MSDASKPKVVLPRNPDDFLLLCQTVLNEIDTDPVLSVDATITAIIAPIDDNLPIALQKQAQQKVKRAEAEVLVADRDALIETMLTQLRLLRDYGFVLFADNFNRLSEMGFEVIQSTSTPANVPITNPDVVVVVPDPDPDPIVPPVQ